MVTIKNQFRFKNGKLTTKAIYVQRILIEKYTVKKEIFFFFDK